MATYTPLRYPGGKSKLAPYVKDLFEINGLCDGDYIEPYAGGAGVALDMLLTEHAGRIFLNDLNAAVFAFWHSVINDTDALCKKIKSCKLSVPAWKRHKNIVRNPHDHSLLDLGFSFFYLNRTNRSGIIGGGVIGGLDQTGNYKIDARFYRDTLIKRIEKIAAYRHRIILSNQDAVTFLQEVTPKLNEKSLIYLDPPYFVKGQRLYDNHYKSEDHAVIADKVASLNTRWLVSYDNVPEIRALYQPFRQYYYDLHYSAAVARNGKEVMIYSDSLEVPHATSADLAAA